MGDAMKARESSTARRMRLKKTSVVEGENVEVVDIGKGKDIDLDITSTTEKLRKKVHKERRTRSSTMKLISPTRMKQKHIVVQKKKISEGLGCKKRKTNKE